MDAELESATLTQRVEMLRAAGVAHRELQQLDRSAEVLGTAADEAEHLGDRRLVGLVRVSLAATVLYRGDATGAIGIIDAALADLDGADRFVALGQRAGILHRAGRLGEALAGFDLALADPYAARPTSALAEVHNNRCILLGYLGRFDEAEAEAAVACDLYVRLGQDKRAVDMLHNRAWIAGRRGDLARALQLFDEARDGYERLGVPADAILPDRCEVLIEAGLLDEAAELAEAACTAFASRGDFADQAESLVLVAQIALMQARWERAADAAGEAATMLERSGRAGWAQHAGALRLEAALGLGAPGDVSAAELTTLRAGLEHSGLDAARDDFDLLRARRSLALGDVDDAAAVLWALKVTSLPGHTRPAARALRAEVLAVRGDLPAARRELRRGLAELDAARQSMGSSELRASIGFHADDVITVGQRLALASGRAPQILAWCERGRARSLQFSSVATAVDDRDERLDRELRELRALEAQASTMPSDDPALPIMRRRIAQGGRRARDRSRHRLGAHRREGLPVSMSSIRARLGAGGCLIQFVADGDVLRVVTVTRRAATVREIGSIATIQRAALTLRESLGRVIVGRGNERMRTSAAELLRHDATALDGLLGGSAPQAVPWIPAAVDHVVLVPTPEVVAVPWGMLASLATVPFVIAPSIGAWLVASTTQAAGADLPGQRLVVGGRRLRFAAAEACAVGSLRDGSVVVVGEDATTATVAELLGDGDIDVAHIVCHGRFVADNPLMSSLEMADGPLFLFDVERLGRLPRLVVLSACYSAISAPRPGEELIGFVSTLLVAGSSSVVASCVPVPDSDDTVAAMVELHREILGGASAAQALVEMRRRSPLLGAAFNVFGASPARARLGSGGAQHAEPLQGVVRVERTGDVGGCAGQ